MHLKVDAFTTALYVAPLLLLKSNSRREKNLKYKNGFTVDLKQIWEYMNHVKYFGAL